MTLDMSGLPSPSSVRNGPDMRGLLGGVVAIGPDMRGLPIPRSPDRTTRVLAIDMEGMGTSYIDNSSSPKTITSTGGISQSSALCKFGTQCVDIPAATGKSLDVAANAAFSLTTFTVHLWFQPTIATSSGIYAIFDLGSYITGFSCRMNQGGDDITVYWNSASSSLAVTVAWKINTWHHIAVTRDSSNNLRIFQNGVLKGTSAGVTQVLSSPPVRVGDILAGGTNYQQKYIDDFVIANTCWWTADFVVPTVPLAGP